MGLRQLSTYFCSQPHLLDLGFSLPVHQNIPDCPGGRDRVVVVPCTPRRLARACAVWVPKGSVQRKPGGSQDGRVRGPWAAQAPWSHILHSTPCPEAPLRTPTPTCEEKPKVRPWGRCLSGSWSPSCLAGTVLQVSHGEQTQTADQRQRPVLQMGGLRPWPGVRSQAAS